MVTFLNFLGLILAMAINKNAINVTLVVLAAVVLMIALSGSITGFVSHPGDISEPECRFETADGESSFISNTDLCCFEIQKLLKCEEIDNFDHVCYNTEDGAKYYLNNNAYNFCLKQGYDI